MREKAIEELITDLMATCGFGAVISPIEPVAGGYSHRMYRVATACGIYAVKYLNPKIMAEPGAHENFRLAEMIERMLENEGIPIVPSITVNGNKMQNIDGCYFYIFNWQEGHITDWSNISDNECNIAGSILGRIHAINTDKVPRQEIELSEINWHEYISKAKEEGNGISPLLADNEGLLRYAEKELNSARAVLPDIVCVTNGDMDPKNIMWDNGNPLVIDLECLGYGNPIAHALQLALEWSGITGCNMDAGKLSSFFEGYFKAYDNRFREYVSVFGLAYSWVEWLEYNVQRALGACADEAERMTGVTEVRNTVNRIRYVRDNEKEIKDTLCKIMNRL